MLFLVCMFPSQAQAVDFRTDYTVQYFIDKVDATAPTHVSFRILVTNLKPDLYIKEFSIMFPKSFQVGNIKGMDDYGAINPKLETTGNKSTVTMQFSNPQAGTNVQNNLYLDFLQYNLFKESGNVWEVILPTIERKDATGDYKITVHLPPNSGKKIGISKPKPTHVTLTEVEWVNPEIKTIYAVFGDRQSYDLQLRYNLENPRLNKVYTDVAFPPDTTYQKVFVSSIKPAPEKMFTDEDGNMMGRYYLNPKESKTVLFTGGVEVYVEPRPDVEKAAGELLSEQKKHLLSTTTLWNLTENQLPKDVSTLQEIYNFAESTLTYNYGRLNTRITRLGASGALKNPDQAVCTEFSDVFISIAREHGFYAREMQGYGFSNDQELRPLSVNQDILHSWPEYFDTARSLWIPLDPTWESTSGIDYHSSFDLNHIVFAIHGKKSDYPYPAGSYKLENETKDINIIASSTYFTELKKTNIQFSLLQIPTAKDKTYSTSFTIQNTGNTVLWNFPLSIESPDALINPSRTVLLSLAPFEKKEIPLEFTVRSTLGDKKILVTIKSENDVLFETALTLIDGTIKKGFVIIGVGIIIIMVMAFFINKNKNKHE